MKKELTKEEKLEMYKRLVNKLELALMGLDVSKAEITNRVSYLKKMIKELES